MLKKIIVIIFVALVFVGIPAKSYAQLARCDACGFCDTAQLPNHTQPQRYAECQACLYPGLSGTQTLQIDPSTNRPPNPQAGKYWSMIGCIDVSTLGGFSSQGAGGSVIQTLLNIIFSIVGGVGFLYILYGSFLVLTSRAEPEKLNYGRRVIFGAIIGIVFSLVSLFVINFLANQIFKIPTT